MPHPLKTPYLSTLSQSGKNLDIKLPKQNQLPHSHLTPMNGSIESIEKVESILEADDETDSIDKAITHVKPPEVVLDISNLE